MTLGPEFETILAAAKCGAEWAWAAIYRDLYGPVHGYFAARGASEPEDLTSEVFLHAARDLPRFAGDESGFRSWIFVIAHRRLIDFWRTASRQSPHVPLTDLLSDPQGGNVQDEAVADLVTQELLSSFEQLTDDQRTVLALRIIAGLSLEDTARVMHRRVGAVKALQRRAVTALRDSLQDRE